MGDPGSDAELHSADELDDLGGGEGHRDNSVDGAGDDLEGPDPIDAAIHGRHRGSCRR